jgi:hypothetical protein
MQTNSHPITIILNLMYSNLIINIANFIFLQLGNFYLLDSFPLKLSLLQLSLQNLKHTAIIRMVMYPTTLLHIPGNYMQIEIFIGKYIITDIIIRIQFYVTLPVGASVLT